MLFTVIHQASETRLFVRPGLRCRPTAPSARQCQPRGPQPGVFTAGHRKLSFSVDYMLRSTACGRPQLPGAGGGDRCGRSDRFAGDELHKAAWPLMRRKWPLREAGISLPASLAFHLRRQRAYLLAGRSACCPGPRMGICGQTLSKSSLTCHAAGAGVMRRLWRQLRRWPWSVLSLSR